MKLTDFNAFKTTFTLAMGDASFGRRFERQGDRCGWIKTVKPRALMTVSKLMN